MQKFTEQRNARYEKDRLRDIFETLDITDREGKQLRNKFESLII